MKKLKILYVAIIFIAAIFCCFYLLFNLKDKQLIAFVITLLGLTEILTYKSVYKK